MVRRILPVIAAAAALGAATVVNAWATAPPRALYADALAREQKVRAALAGDDTGAPTVNEVRAVIAAYEAIVRRYPASGYSDNALWQAGRLALDAFARFGQPRDRNTGLRLLRALETQYPTSKLAKRVGAERARAETTADAKTAEADPASSNGARGPTPARSGISRSSIDSRARVTLATIKTVTRAALPDAVRVTIELDSEVPFHEERLSDPARVFVDLSSTRAAPSLLDQTLRFDGDADLVRQIRIGRHPNATTRVVLDAVGVWSYSVYALYNPYRLVIDCARPAAGTAPPPAVAPSALAVPPAMPPAVTRESRPHVLPARRVASEWGRRLPVITPRAAERLAAARAPDPPPPGTDALPTPPATMPTVPSTKNLAGGLSISRQLGLSVSRIVIDPGHGGHDSGAKGKGITEAELVLDVALRLEMLLQKIPGAEVILTRRTDEFIPLPERTAMANREGADLFLSIHANASPNAQARGIETFFLNFANNRSAAAVAARENAASSMAMGALPDFVKAIALNNKLDESRDFATQVQRAMLEKARGTNKTVKDLGVKQAPFVVLIGATMPSVLAEISFVTNPQEARLLRGAAYRQRIAEALLAAIRKYQTSLKTVMAVAHQP
jgi:N-acetylmuramoyl-L-alanine amidase